MVGHYARTTVFLFGILSTTLAAADEVVLKDGSRIIGEVLELTDGKLKMKTVFNKEVVIDWPEVVSLTTDKPLTVVLDDAPGGRVTSLSGPAVAGGAGELTIQTQLAAPVPVPLATVKSINAPPKPAMTFKGFAAIGLTVNDGNTQNKSFFANAEFEARAERQRFTLRGSTNYAEDTTGLTARNSRGILKYDFFVVPPRFYLFASALFEGDHFQDLKLRTALSAGPGYQFIDTGDFQRPIFKELQLSGEAGISYFDEDFDDAPDQAYVAARWAVKLNWAIIPKKIVIFHIHEGYPSLERAGDIYILSEQGVRFLILENFFAAIQVNWRWDNTPAPDRERDDTTYLFSLGYNFDFHT